MTAPNPGSTAAREQGCTCPVLDNDYGCRPAEWPWWVIREDCPLHGAERNAVDRSRRVLREVGALLGHPNPQRFADLVLAPPCEHYGAWYFDEHEVCPEPCGQRHEWCSECHRPMKPPCPYLALLEATT